MSWVDDEAGKLGLGLSPNAIERLIDYIAVAPAGSFQADAWPYGRAVLLAAAEEAHWRIRHHAETLRLVEKSRQVLHDAIAAVDDVMVMDNLADELLYSAKSFRAVATRYLAVNNAKEPPKRKGAPKGSVRGAIAFAAAKVYAQETGKPIPRAAIKTDALNHPLRLLLEAISQDLFANRDQDGLVTRLGNKGEITPNHLAGVRMPSWEANRYRARTLK